MKERAHSAAVRTTFALLGHVIGHTPPYKYNTFGCVYLQGACMSTLEK